MTSASPRSIKCLASFGKDEPLKPWVYQSRPLGAMDVEIKISHCGICGSDVHTVDSGWGPTAYPCVVGHEIVGEITQTGPEVKELVVGDRVGVGAAAFGCFSTNSGTVCKWCASGQDAYCDHGVGTYNFKYPDGAMSYGGYAEYVRVAASHAFKIPANLPSDVAAPLLCAGATVFAPLKEANVKPGDRVGVVGIGGLGHLAIQFVRALGATAVAFSRSANKETEVRALGAHEFVNTSDDEQAAKAAGSVDVLLITANAENMSYNLYLSFLIKRGTCIMVGAPVDEVRFNQLILITRGIKFCGSLIGSVPVIKDMLQLAAEKNVRPVIQKLPMAEANKGLDMVRSNAVRYRVVLEN